MKKELLIATGNNHKVEEFKQILGSEYNIKCLKDFDITEDIPETGSSFEENALIKAKYCYEKTGIPCISDDSGLVIPALNGEPGIHSARYAGNHDFNANIEKVLNRLKLSDHREAYFICIICFIDSSGAHYFQGKVDGKIIKECSGVEGFGYDPIFIPNGYSKTFAEMESSEKNSISHRRMALDKLIPFLNNREN